MKRVVLFLIQASISLLLNAQAIYIVGSGNGLSWNLPGVAYYPGENGSYQITFDDLQSFKMSTVAATTWDEFNAASLGYNGDFDDCVFDENGKTIFLSPCEITHKMPSSGNYTITISRDLKTMNIKANFSKGVSAIYIRGEMNNWEVADQWQFTYNELEDKYYFRAKDKTKINKNTYFAFADEVWLVSWGNRGEIIDVMKNSQVELSFKGADMRLVEDFEGTICLDISNIDEANVSFTKEDGGTGKPSEPEGPDYPNNSGVYMGLISFSDVINYFPISILDNSTESSFVDFINDMEMANATILYYAVDQAVDKMGSLSYPTDLTNAVIITFTDGLDQGSLAKKPEMLTSRNYAKYLFDKISSTNIQGNKLQAYTIGLKGKDVSDDELFMVNLESLSSSAENAHSVEDIDDVKYELDKLYEQLSSQTRQKILSVTVPMMSHGDRYRFTLDSTTAPDKVDSSNLWFEGVFDITNCTFNEIEYHGFTSASGNSITAERNGVYIILTLNDCRNMLDDVLEIEKNDIDQWLYIPSKNTWQHNVENDKEGNIKIEEIHTSAAIMFVLDCSTSLGESFPILKQTAISFIDRLAGNEGGSDGVTEIIGEDVDANEYNDGVEYYNMLGIRVKFPHNGMYIKKSGNIARKIYIK